MSAGEWIVRPLTAADANERQELRLEALRDFPAAYGSTFETESLKPLEHFAQFPDPEHGLMVGAFVGAHIIGMASIRRFESPSTRHWGHLTGMYVRPAFWSSGVADAIMCHLMDFAREKFEFVELSATHGNDRAYRFYARHGFREFGRRPRSMRHGGRDYDEILMWRAS